MSKLCKHCRGPLAIRLPKPQSGCDHLYYPENCVTCRIDKPTDANLLKEENEKQASTIRQQAETIEKLREAIKYIYEWNGVHGAYERIKKACEQALAATDPNGKEK